MSLPGSNVARTLIRLLVVAAVAAVLPACGTTKKKDPPNVLSVFPDPLTNASRFPNIFLRFDKALDPASVSGSIQLIDQSNNIQTITVSYNPGLYEIRVVPQPIALGMNATPSGTTKAYQLNIFPGLMSADGATLEQGLFFQFNVPANDDNTQPSFGGISTVTAGPNPQTELTLTWPAASDTNFKEYRIYQATNSGTQDLALGTPVAVVSTIGTTTTNITGLSSNTTYYYVIKAVDNAGNLDGQFTEKSGTTAP